MGSKGKVVSLGAAGLGFIFDPIVAGLRDRGHEVSHHIDPARFLREAGEIMRDADAFITLGSIPCSREFMLKAPRLRGIVSPFIGTESIDEAAATELGIIVANGQVPENYLSVSESTILLILACLYSLHWWERRLRDNLPHPESVPGRMLRGRTVGMIGFGNIARGIAARLQGWDVVMQTYTPRLRSPLPDGIRRVDLEELLATSDVVCVLAPLNDETRGMLNMERLRMMKPDAVLVNTSRGGIVDEAALVQIARERPGFRIALDVFAREPLPAESPLREIPEAILTPHAIGHTRESVAALPPAAIENASRIVRGELPLYVRNPAVIPEWKRRWAGAA
jgi:phosphoglycerate dehydrogenase-like enzyme